MVGLSPHAYLLHRLVHFISLHNKCGKFMVYIFYVPRMDHWHPDLHRDGSSLRFKGQEKVWHLVLPKYPYLGRLSLSDFNAIIWQNIKDEN